MKSIIVLAPVLWVCASTFRFQEGRKQGADLQRLAAASHTHFRKRRGLLRRVPEGVDCQTLVGCAEPEGQKAGQSAGGRARGALGQDSNRRRQGSRPLGRLGFAEPKQDTISTCECHRIHGLGFRV